MADTSTLFTVYGTPGDDFIIGTNGNDLLDGGDGSDQLLGLAGDDVLVGGHGFDNLDGGSGNDTYVFAVGDGLDTIWEGAGTPDAGGLDTVRLLDGYDPATTQLYRYGNDLAIRSTSGDEIVVREHFGSMLDGNTRAAIEQIIFADGTIWDTGAINTRLASMNSNLPTDGNDTIGGTPWADSMDAMAGHDTLSGGGGDDFLQGALGNDRVFGGEGNDFVGGGDGNDLLAGGSGSDVLKGGAGSDTYLINLGDGHDQISEMSMPGETNRVIFGEGIQFEDLQAWNDYYSGSVRIDIGTAGDQIELFSTVLDPYSPHAIDRFLFADGTTASFDAIAGYGAFFRGSTANDSFTGGYYADSLYGNGGNDSLSGDYGNDLLAGGQGNDWLIGGGGSDTYIFNLGDGVDFIGDDTLAGEVNRVQFGTGISVDDLRLVFDGWMAHIDVGAGGDALNFSSFFPLDPYAPRSVGAFEFADGSTLKVDELIARGFYFGGNEWNDYLTGTSQNDRIYGYGGDDFLHGLAGNDTLVGGTGTDSLDGGFGDDLYVFAAGDGFDFIFEGTQWGPNGPEAGGIDTVQLLDGYDPATTQLYRNAYDLSIRSPAGDEIVVREHFGNYVDGSTRAAIERIVFADGTVWNTAAINSRLASLNNNMPTEGGDTIGGTVSSEYLNAMGGNDTVSGGQGDDQIFGGAGNDLLFGGQGNDSLQGELGNDTLAGGTGDDLLAGGVGNDTYLFNPGDGVDRVEEFAAPGERNRVIFGGGIRQQDLQGSYDANLGAAVIDIGNSGDRLIVGSAGPQTVASFQFADGTLTTLDAILGYGLNQQGSQYGDWLTGSWYADSLNGNGGDDSLYGDAGNDILAGGQGNDVLSGGAGDDSYVFNRGDGMDVIEDYAFEPIEGNRVVFGEGITADDLRLRMDGPVPRIEIAGTPGDGLQFSNLFPLDPMAPRSVSTFEFADGSTLSLDALIARGFYQEGFDWSYDYLIGSPYNDRMYGLGGDDVLQGMAGNDTLVGGTGNDQLDGGSGNDTYVFAAGDGFDMIWEGSGTPAPEAGGTDTVQLSNGYDPAATMLSRAGDDLVIMNAQAGDQVIVREHFGNPIDGSTRSAIEQITFSDGTIWDAEAISSRLTAFNNNMPTDGSDTIGGTPSPDYLNAMGGNDTISGGQGDDNLDGASGNDKLFGGAGNDSLFGDEGNDTLAGGTGDDSLIGGAGSDTYRFNLGDGQDRILDNPFPDESNRVVFGDGIRFADVRVYADYGLGGVAIDVGSGGDRLLLPGAAPDPYGPHLIDTFQFADGTLATFDAIAGYGGYQMGGAWNESMYGTAYADSLYGNGGDDQLVGDFGNDILSGGQGNDQLSGGSGNDTYLFNLGDGVDAIDDYAYQSFEGNRVVFGAGIAANDLQLTVDGTVVKLAVGSAGDALVFSNADRFNPLGMYPVQTFEFADGSMLSYAQLVDRGFVISGSSLDDVITGTMVTDNLSAGAGNDTVSALDGNDTLNGEAGFDTLWGEGGDDTLIGGADNDILIGGQGNDRYVFNLGDGVDFIDDSTSLLPYDDNRVVFGAGITLADLRLRSDGVTGYLEIGALGDTLRFSSFSPWDPAAPRSVSSFEFADGSVLTTDELLAAINEAPVAGTALPDQVATEENPWGMTIPFGMFVDPNGGPMAYSVSLADGSPLPSWLSFDPTFQTLSGVPQNGDVGSLALRLTATDSLGAAVSSDFNLTVLNVNDAPVVSSPLMNQLATEDSAFSYALPADAFQDVDVGDNLSYAAFLADGSPLPSWLSFDPMTRTFSGTPGNADVGTLNVRVKVFDASLAAAFTDFSLAIVNVNDAPVTGMPFADQVATEDAAFSFIVPADAFADVDVGDVPTLGATLADGTALPAWLSFDAATRTFSGTPTNDDVGNLEVRITATDSAGASVSSSFALTVANTNDAPIVANAIADQSAAEGQAFSVEIAADAFGDVDVGDALTFDAALVDGSPLPAWLSFDAITRSFTGTPGDGTAGDYNVRVTATDSTGVNVSDDFVLNVADSIATVITGNSSANTLYGTAFRDVLNGLGGNDTLYGYAGDDLLDGGSGSDSMYGGAGNDTYVVNGTGDVVVEGTGEGIDTVQSSISYTLGTAVENLTLTGTYNRNGTGNSLDNLLTGNSGANTLTGNAGNDTLNGGAGNDSLRGGTGNDTYVFTRGYGTDSISENDATTGNTDTVALGVDALDVVFARSGSNLLMTLHGGTDKLTVGSWYSGSQYQTEVIQAADGQQLLNTQVDQLIQAMASFSATSGLTWDQAIDQRPQDVQVVLAAYWQPAA